MDSSLNHGDLGELRKELEEKIDKKLPTWVFTWVVGALVLVLIAVCGGGFREINNISTKLTTLETKVQDHLEYSNQSHHT